MTDFFSDLPPGFRPSTLPTPRWDGVDEGPVLVFPNIAEPGIPPGTEFDHMRHEIDFAVMRKFAEQLLFMYELLAGNREVRGKRSALDDSDLRLVDTALFERYDPGRDRTDDFRIVLDALRVFREKNEEQLEIAPEGICLLGLSCAGKTVLSEILADRVPNGWTIGEQDEFELVTVYKGYLSPLSHGQTLCKRTEDVTVSRMLGHLYASSRTEGHVRLNFLYYILARNGVRPVVSGNMVQNLAAIASYCHFGEYEDDGTPVHVEIPRLWREFYELLPWRPEKFVRVIVSQEDVTERIRSLMKRSLTRRDSEHCNHLDMLTDQMLDASRMMMTGTVGDPVSDLGQEWFDYVRDMQCVDFNRRRWALKHWRELLRAYTSMIYRGMLDPLVTVENSQDRDPLDVATEILESAGRAGGASAEVDVGRLRRDIAGLFNEGVVSKSVDAANL